MSIVLEKQPFEIAFVKNPIYFQFSTTEVSIRTEIYIETWHNSNSFAKIITLDSLADNLGIVDLEIQDILKSQLSHTLPDYGDTAIQEVINSIKRFYLVAKSYDAAGDLVSTLILNNSTDYYTAVLGGISHEEYPTAGFWQNYFPDNKIFLSWQGQSISLDHSQPYFLNYMCWADFQALYRKVKIYYTDGSSEIKSTLNWPAATDKYTHFIIPSGWDYVSTIANAAKIVEKYDVWLEYFDGTSLLTASETVTFTIDTDTQEYARYFHYFNSLSGLDTFRSIGVTTENFTNSFVMLAKSIKPDYKITDGTVFHTNILEKANYITASGWLTETQLDHLRDMLLSSDIFYIHKSEYLKILISGSTIKHKENEFLYALLIKYTHNFANQVYTPGMLRTIQPETFYRIINTSNDKKLINSTDYLLNT